MASSRSPCQILKTQEGQKQQGGLLSWDEDHVLKRSHKNPVCVSVCVVAIVEKGKRGIMLLFVCCLVQVQCVKKPRRRVRGHQVGFKSGCTSPRCAAWRLKQWRADSSPALAQGRYHKKRQIDQTHTHKITSFAVTPTIARVLVEWLALLMSFGNKEGLLSLKEGLSGGWGGGGASLSSSIAMPTISSAVPSSSCQEAVIELTFQSGSFNEALRLASNAEQTRTRYTTLYGESALLWLLKRRTQ